MVDLGVSYNLSRRKPGFNSPWDYQKNINSLDVIISQHYSPQAERIYHFLLRLDFL